MEENKKRIVCLGGGNAMSKAVLEGLKNYPVKISAVTAALDSGGSAGREREYFKTKISFGDFRRAALALSDVAPEKKEFFTYRYQDEFNPLKNHVMANLYSTASVVAADNFEKAIEELSQDLKDDLKIPAQHQILPVTLEDSTLCLELENGEIIEGEGNIDVPKYDANLEIKRIFLKPEVKAYPKALRAIKEADLITIGPGDLFSSLVQILLVDGIPQAIQKSHALKVYICNLLTKRGETNNFSVSDFAKEIEKLLGTPLDYVIYNNFVPDKARVRQYKKEHPELMELVKVDDSLPKYKFIGANLLPGEGPLIHDKEKLTKIIFSLCLYRP